MPGNTSYTNASNNLYAALCAAGGTTNGTPAASLAALGVTKVWQYEPRLGDLVKPLAVTIMPAGVKPTDYMFTVRIYASLEESPQAGVTNLVATIDALDQLFKPVQYGASEYETGFLETDGGTLIVAKTTGALGREDGF